MDPKIEAPVVPVTPAAPVTNLLTEPPKAPPVAEPTNLLTEKPKEPAPVEPVVEPPKTVEPFDATKLTLPEGLKADDPALKSFNEVIGSDMAPTARAQKLLDIYTGLTKANAEAQAANWSNLNKDWADKVRADPEVGGPNLEKTIAKIQQVKAMPQFAVPGLDEALAMTGAANNPAIFKFLSKLSNAVTEGKFVSGSPAAPPKSDPASLFYPNMKTGT